MSDLFFYDTETFSTVHIGLGLDRYMTGMRPLIYSYALNDGPVEVWDTNDSPTPPAMLEDNLRDDRVIKVAHNMPFDHKVSKFGLGINVPFESEFCTMSCAYAHGLPGSLEALGPVVGIDNDFKKMAVGKELIKMFCVPGPDGKPKATPESHPVEWAQFLDYAGQDTVALREIYNRMPKFNYINDGGLWAADMEINERGFFIDQDLCEKALVLRDAMREQNEREITNLTDGVITKGTQRTRILHHMVGEYGFWMLDLKADTIKKELEENRELTPDARRLLELRRDSSLTSLAKYERALERVGDDGRMRDTLQYSGAGRTGRHAGRGFQPHNMPRPKVDAEKVDVYIEAIKNGTLAQVTTDVNQACSDSLRGSIVAEDGNELIVGDWSNIEGRCLAWEADEEWKVKAFYANDAGTGPDLYNLLYSQSFNVPVESVDKKQRSIGKVQELGCGYGGGVGAFLQFAASYSMDLPELGRIVPGLVSDKIYNKAEKAWERAFVRGEDFMLEADEYIACDSLKQVWRSRNSNIVQLWWDVERAVKWAIERPGSIHKIAKCKIWRTPAWLIIELPSGRRLLYASPELKTKVEYDEDTGRINERTSISYMAATAKQWRRDRTYGGKVVENITQAIANDILRVALLRAKTAGYPVVLHVHDELIVEMLLGMMSLQDLLDLMEQPIDWAHGLPLKAAGYTSLRYKKD